MRMGLSFLPDVSPSRMPAAAYFANALALTRIADDAGMHSIKMTEHYLHPYGGYCPSPLGFFAAAAARTRRIRLVTGGVLPVFHHPVQLAAETAMVDAISKGRLEVGFARAYLPHEFAALGVPIDESRARFVATVDAVVRLWTEERVDVETPFFALRGATSLPRPTQHPHPPVWVAASLSPESFAWVGRKGFKLMATFVLTDRAYLAELLAAYRAAFDRAGTRPEVALSLPLYVAHDDAAARARGADYLERSLAVWESAAAAWAGVRSSAYPGYTHLPEIIRATTPADMQRAGSAVFGCPERVADHVAWLGEDLNVDHLMWQVDFGGMPREVSMANVTTFVEHVVPRLALDAPPRAPGGDVP